VKIARIVYTGELTGEVTGKVTGTVYNLDKKEFYIDTRDISTFDNYNLL